jgi:hypothetical protein
MSSFKEIKKREKIKAWESKIRRLYACENVDEDDLKFLNIQYDLYKLRKTNCYIWGISACGISYILPIINEMFWLKKALICTAIGVLTYSMIRKKNRNHYETIIMPYFEKYHVK